MTRRSWVQAPHGTFVWSGVKGLSFNHNPLDNFMTILASLAQSGLERVAFNLVVVGSTPTGGID